MTARKPGSMYGWGWQRKLAAVVPEGDPGECWRADPRQSSIDPDGYAHVSAHDTAETLVHRLAVMADGRQIPPGHDVDHLAGVCSWRDCGNPAHLEVVTHAENVRRAAFRRPPKLICLRGHDRSNPYSDGSCRTCKREDYLERSTPRQWRN